MAACIEGLSSGEFAVVYVVCSLLRMIINYANGRNALDINK